MNHLKVAMIVADERDVQQRYSAPTPWFGPAPSALLAGLRERRDLEVHVISCIRQPALSPLQLDENTFYHGVRIPAWGYLKSLYLPSILRIRALVRRIQAHVAHGQGTERYYALAAVHSGKPSLVTILGNMRAVSRQLASSGTSFHRITATLERHALVHAAGVCYNSSYTLSQIAPVSKRTFYVPNAVRSEFLDNAPEPRSNCAHLLNVGTIVSYKQPLELLALARRMHELGCKFRLDFIGGAADDRYASRFKEEVARAERAGFATWHGQLTLNETMARMDAAGALVHVSKEESFGLVVAEALARNLKVFAFDAGGVADVLLGMPGAAPIPACDWSALQEALLGWIRGGCVGQGSNGQVRNRYSPRIAAEAQMEAYEALLALTRLST